jgi:hypothetical protein
MEAEQQTAASPELPNTSFGEFVPDPQVIREFGITAMSLWRWDRDPVLKQMGWPAPVRIRKRKFRPRRALEAFKATMFRHAVEARKGLPGGAP